MVLVGEVVFWKKEWLGYSCISFAFLEEATGK